MVKEQYESLKTGGNLRKDLIALKQELKQEESRQELLEIQTGAFGNPEGGLHSSAGFAVPRGRESPGKCGSGIRKAETE